MSLDMYWQMYERTLARIRAERPATFAGLKLILDPFHKPSAGEAFFPDGADDTLADALSDSGWSISFEGGHYVYTAVHTESGAVMQNVEGDLYCLLEGRVSR